VRFPPGMMALMALAACHTGESQHRLAKAADAAPTAMTVTASDFTFDGPAEIPAGLTTIRLVNRGPSLHHIQLIKLEQGKTVDDLLAAFKAPGPPPNWISYAGGPNPPEPGSTTNVTLTLEPGSYAMVCFIPTPDGTPHVMKGMARALSVTGPSRPGMTEESPDVVMKLVDYDFQLSKPLTAGRHTIRIENSAAQPHEIAIVRLKLGKTPLDFAAWGEKQVGPAPGTVQGGVSAIMPGMHASVGVELPAGDYGLICFIPDVKDGKPHFVHGMAKLIKVT
jgi:hypothetical protein